jgi:hypothetical protein
MWVGVKVAVWNRTLSSAEISSANHQRDNEKTDTWHRTISLNYCICYVSVAMLPSCEKKWFTWHRVRQYRWRFWWVLPYLYTVTDTGWGNLVRSIWWVLPCLPTVPDIGWDNFIEVPVLSECCHASLLVYLTQGGIMSLKYLVSVAMPSSWFTWHRVGQSRWNICWVLPCLPPGLPDTGWDNLVEIFGECCHASLLGKVGRDGQVQEPLQDPHQP